MVEGEELACARVRRPCAGTQPLNTKSSPWRSQMMRVRCLTMGQQHAAQSMGFFQGSPGEARMSVPSASIFRNHAAEEVSQSEKNRL